MSTAAQAVADTVRWLERAVIGLNLCPFAKVVHAKAQIHYVACLSPDDAELLDVLLTQADELRRTDPAQRDTTLIVAPRALPDFLAFHDWVLRAQRRLNRAGHEGVLQLASFHPGFQFAGTAFDDMGNATNRSPHPTLHLLREDSIERATQAFPDAAAIFERNIERMHALGAAGWAALGLDPHADQEAAP